MGGQAQSRSVRYPPVWNDTATADTLADPRRRDADVAARRTARPLRGGAPGKVAAPAVRSVSRVPRRRQARWLGLSMVTSVAGVLLSSGIRSMVQPRFEQSIAAPAALVRPPPPVPVIVPIPRQASGGDSLAAIGELNDRAMAAYQATNFGAARALLLEALAGEGRLHLQRHPVAAVTHAYLGVVLISGLGQWQPGVEEFRQAVAIDPDVTLPRQYVKRAVTAAIRQAVPAAHPAR